MTLPLVRQLIGATCVGLLASIAGAQEVGTVASLNGSAQLGKEGEWRPVAISSPVYTGDTIRTGQPGRLRIVFQDDSVLNVGDGSEIVVDEQVFDPAGGSYQSAFRLLRGKLRALVSQYYESPNAGYEIETPTAVAGVRGTEFVLAFDEMKRQTQVVGVDGRVAVNALRGRPGEEVLVTAGELTTVATGAAPTLPRRINENLFRQYIEGLEFIGQGRAESLSADHPLVVGVDVPQSDRAPVSDAGAPDGRGGHDASSLIGQPPAVIEDLQGGLSVRF